MKITDLLLTQDITYKEVPEVTGTLTLDPNKSITLTLSNQNLIITGKLISRPIWPAVHIIRFAGVDESKFVGGGEAVLDSDKGLWCMGNGQLDLQGESKTRWTTAVGGIPAGATSFIVKDCTNWHPGDEIVIARTAKGAIDDDVRTVKNIDFVKKIITVDKPLAYDHPMVNNTWTAEVLNLTSNLRIEGTATGSAHIFVMSMMMQNIQNAQIRYMGPRKNTAGGAEKELVKGRYAVHLHHCMDGSIGSEIMGNAFRDCNNHIIVPHMSNGVCACENCGYNLLEVPLWIDFNEESHGTLYQNNCFGKIGYVDRSVTLEDPDTTTFGVGAAVLGMGDNNTCTDNVAFGISGQVGIDGTGDWQWRNNNERGRWKFARNRSHHGNGGSVWQNTAENHTIDDQEGYYNRLAWFHGAYANDYEHRGGTYYDCALVVRGGSLTPLRLRFGGMTIINGGPGYGDTANIKAGIIQVGSPVGTIAEGQPPVLYRGIKFINCPNEIILAGGEQPHYADVVDCNIVNPIVRGNEVMRVQQNGAAYQLTASGKKTIPLFAPTSWGNGDGVKVEYFNDTAFKNKVAEDIEPQINFSEWQNIGKVHHLITSTKYSVRFTGKLQPQYSDNFTFTMPADSGGSSTLWINGAQVKGSVALKQGQQYDFKIDFVSSGSNIAGLEFRWYCPQMDVWHKGGEVVPRCQLYLPGTTPPVNKPPIANAGADQVIQLPINSTVLNGSGSDSDGVITAYKWTGKGTIVDSDKPSCRVTGLVEGDYVFTLQVTDDKGATATDSVMVTVKPVVVPPPNQPPVVTAGASVNVIKTGTIFLNGAGVDPEGGALSYLWRQTSGPLVTITNTAAASTDVQKAPEGSYKFILKVTDNAGNSVEKVVSVTI